MDDTGDGSGLPASIEAAWGLRDRPARGPKRGLSLERIVEAGIQIALSQGLAGLSMSKVAAQLGASTMSLYRYVAAKDELLALMFDAAIGLPPADATPERGWREGLTRWAWAERAAYYAHPWSLRVPISGPPVTPNQIAWMEAALACMRDTALTYSERLSTLLLLTSFVRVDATLAADIGAAKLAAADPEQQVMPSWSAIVGKLIDEAAFPALSAAMASGALEEDDDQEAEFVFGLERILDGVEALIRTRG